MAAIGCLLFCTDCGNLLDPNVAKGKHVLCDVCGVQNEDTSSKTIVSTSKPTAFPSTLRTKLRSDVREVTEAEMQREATIVHPCENCGCEEVRYTTQQLRSADEGTTIFFNCPQCRHKWIVQN